MTYRHIALSALAAAAITLTGCGGGSSSTGTDTNTTTDTTAPVVVLNGTSTVNLTVGDSYTDAGATATDDVDGALTPTSTSTVDADTAGTYAVTYSATDTAGNTGSATRTVVVAMETVEITQEEIAGNITADKTLTADKVWILDGQVEVNDGVTLTIEPGTTIAGKEGTDAWLFVQSGAKLMAEGTAANPIVFTSEAAINGETEAPEQWGGVTIIGNSANSQTGKYEVDDATEAGTSGATSGSLKYVTINNSGIAVAPDKEINGLSLFGVSSTTSIENITVNRSGDDGIEIWGGDVNLKDVTIDGAQDDSFDTDSGWAGEIDGLTITNGKKAGIEMSGTSVGTYKNVTMTIDIADSEG